MKIVEALVYSKSLPVAGSYNMSTSQVDDPETTILELRTDSGLIGWGEACPAGPVYQPAHARGIQAALDLLGPILIGADPTKIGLVHHAMESTLNGSPEAKAMVDIACWDITGRAYGERVCDLLGGARMDPVLTYHVVSIGSPEQSAERSIRLQDDGHTKLQLKAGGRHIDADIEAIRAVVAVIRPDVDLFVDANRGWTVGEAIQVSNACADLNFAIEQPCNSYEECAAAKPSLRHPLLLDESATDLATIARSIADGVANGFGMKLTRAGGLSAMRAVRDLCAATRTPMSCDDSWGGDIIAAACIHIGATLDPQLSRGAWISDPYQVEHYDPANGPRIADGVIAIPVGPGLGITIPDGYFGPPLATYTKD